MKQNYVNGYIEAAIDLVAAVNNKKMVRAATHSLCRSSTTAAMRWSNPSGL